MRTHLPQNPLFVAMDVAQRNHFLEALARPYNSGAEHDLGTILVMIADIDASKAECRNPEDRDAILSELEALVGTRKLTELVRDLTRRALLRVARDAVDAQSAEEKARGALTGNLGTLLYDMGDYEGAKPLYEEVLAARREVLGDRHEGTLTAIGNLGALYRRWASTTRRGRSTRRRWRRGARRWATSTRAR